MSRRTGSTQATQNGRVAEGPAAFGSSIEPLYESFNRYAFLGATAKGLTASEVG